MNGQELKLLFKLDKAYLTNDKPMTFDEVILPEIAKKGFKNTAYWKIRVINYEKIKKEIFCEILSYHKGDTELKYNQSLLNQLNDIKCVRFKHISTTDFLRTLEGGAQLKSTTRPKDSTHEKSLIKRKPPKKTINDNLSIPLKDVVFKTGGITFTEKIKEYKQPVEFYIKNTYIRKEFDAIKKYFSNVLKTKRIQVKVTVEVEGEEIISKFTHSSEINRINHDIIDQIKLEYVKDIKKKSNTNTDKSVFTMDEFFEAFSEKDFKADIFYKDAIGFFNDLQNVSSSMHYKHLNFLAGKHFHDLMKLRFINNPFSFIFLIEGIKNYYIIWETLDTKEATYLWSIEKNINILRATVKEIEDTIKKIKVEGKTKYISTADESFKRIYHDYSHPTKGFEKWKKEVQSYLL